MSLTVVLNRYGYEMNTEHSDRMELVDIIGQADNLQAMGIRTKKEIPPSFLSDNQDEPILTDQV